MSRQKTIRCCGAALVAACLSLAACGDEGGSEEADAAVNAADANTVFQCDPKGVNPEMGDLLNAELEQGVEVIVKEPVHPGNPGPIDLP